MSQINLVNLSTVLPPAVALSYVTDAGTAIPALNVLNIVGTTAQGITSAGAGSTVTFTIADAAAAQKGVTELCTDAEVIAGSLTDYHVVNPSNLKAKLGTQTDHGVLVGAGTAAALTALAVGTDGQVLLGSTGADPVFGTLTSTDGSVTFTAGAGTLDLSAEGVDQTEVIYVGKFGNDANDGRTVSRAKLTLQSGETAANSGDTMIVYPGTYTETVTHSKSNLTVIAQGKTNNVIITQADANVINFGAYTGIQYKYFGISCTAATTAINTVQGSTGGCTFKECHLTMTCAAAIAAAVQPAVGSITGAGELKVTVGRVNYAHTGAGGATANKGAFRVADGGTVTLQRINDLTVANSGTALVTAVGVDTASTGVFKMNDNKITVTDPNSTIVAGFVALGGTGTTHEFFRNTVHVTATNNNGYGFWSGDTASSSRFFYNHIHVVDTAGASYSFLVGNGATVISQLDDIVADDGVSIAGLGVFTEASSNKDGQIDLCTPGTVKATTDILTITNTGNAADMDGTGEGILFRQTAFNAATPLQYDSGRIAMICEQDWTTVSAASRDSLMQFSTSLNGTVAPKVTILSSGFTGMGIEDPVSNLHIAATNVLGNVANDTTLIVRITDTLTGSGNLNYLDIGQIKLAPGAEWNNSGIRIKTSADDNATVNSWIDLYHLDAVGSNGIRFGEANTVEWMRIENGLVGIGTIAAITTLDVTGKIRWTDATFLDEFWNGARPEWATDVTTGSVAAQARQNGWLRLTTGATATNEESLDFNDITVCVNTLRPMVEVRLDMEAITNIEIEVGLKESEGVGVDDYIMIAFDPSAQNTWYLQASSGGATTTDQGAVADLNEVLLRFEFTSDTELEWFINGVSQGVAATNVPTVLLQPFIRIRTEENAVHYVDFDLFKVYQDRT